MTKYSKFGVPGTDFEEFSFAKILVGDQGCWGSKLWDIKAVGLQTVGIKAVGDQDYGGSRRWGI